MEESSTESLVVSCNQLAMDHLRNENPRAAIHLLKRAQELLQIPMDTPTKLKLQALTHNNLGCYYKSQGQPSHALQNLSKALSGAGSKVDVAGTHLTIASVRSSLDQHEIALKHTNEAIAGLLESEATDPSVETKKTLAIAYHNAGLENRKLGKDESAAQMFQFGLSIAERYLGKHPVTDAIKSSMENKSKKFVFARSRNIRKHSLPKIRRTPRSQVSSRPTDYRISRIDSRGKSSAIKRPLPRPEKFAPIRTAQFGVPRRNREFVDMCKACIVIQRFARGFLSRRRIAREKIESSNIRAKNAIEALEALKREVMNEMFDIERPSFRSIQCVQSYFRGFLAKMARNNIVQETYNTDVWRNKQKVRRIQAAIRGYLIKKKFNKIKRAAVFIQSFYRMHPVRNLYLNIYAAILCIQRYWRAKR